MTQTATIERPVDKKPEAKSDVLQRKPLAIQCDTGQCWKIREFGNVCEFCALGRH